MRKSKKRGQASRCWAPNGPPVRVLLVNRPVPHVAGAESCEEWGLIMPEAIPDVGEVDAFCVGWTDGELCVGAAQARGYLDKKKHRDPGGWGAGDFLEKPLDIPTALKQKSGVPATPAVGSFSPDAPYPLV